MSEATKIKITQLIIYPVKSLAGISLQNSELDSMGLKYDRRWMLVTPEGKFLSQRQIPQMALIKTALDSNGRLTLSKQGMQDHLVPDVSEPSESTKLEIMSVTIWNDVVQATKVGDETDIWLSNALNTLCHLVYISENEVRQCDLDYAKQGDRTGFSDGFPILLLSEASLADLNNRLDEPVAMKRFRPNIVVSGCDAFAEDQLKSFTLGDVAMRGVKLCSRCVITTVNPETGERTNMEPLATLMKYRKGIAENSSNKVFFGMNVIHENQGRLKVGDVIKETLIKSN